MIKCQQIITTLSSNSILGGLLWNSSSTLDISSIENNMQTFNQKKKKKKNLEIFQLIKA